VELDITMKHVLSGKGVQQGCGCPGDGAVHFTDEAERAYNDFHKQAYQAVPVPDNLLVTHETTSGKKGLCHLKQVEPYFYSKRGCSMTSFHFWLGFHITTTDVSKSYRVVMVKSERKTKIDGNAIADTVLSAVQATTSIIAFNPASGSDAVKTMVKPASKLASADYNAASSGQSAYKVESAQCQAIAAFAGRGTIKDGKQEWFAGIEVSPGSSLFVVVTDEKENHPVEGVPVHITMKPVHQGSGTQQGCGCPSDLATIRGKLAEIVEKAKSTLPQLAEENN